MQNTIVLQVDVIEEKTFIFTLGFNSQYIMYVLEIMQEDESLTIFCSTEFYQVSAEVYTS